ncbi:MAG: ABC transporter ATP-binding protein, partial [Erysipelotrichaceae bacterium]|nr:ABC transporter ATP-binding protein [Erysipelotrichaceae bacterium]
LKVNYGMIEAVKGIDFEVNDGQIVALIGANGAGKTTTMHTISGLIKPSAGRILLDDRDISRLPAHRILDLGIAQCPEGRRLFAQLTILENLDMGAYRRKDKAEVENDMKNVFSLFPILEERKHQLAGTLSGGEQQMLAMGRALMARPKIMLLDEPSMGLSPLLVKEIFNIIRNINSQGVTVLLVEQNAKMALGIADRAYVLETGKIVMSGTGEQLLNSEDIKKAYLGG